MTESLTLSTLPTLGATLDTGIFAGITTCQNGTHCAVVLLPEEGKELTWKKAISWAQKQGGELPTRAVASMLFANISGRLISDWHWTSDEYDASSAWGCHFYYGYITRTRKSYEGSAVAVRRLVI